MGKINDSHTLDMVELKIAKGVAIKTSANGNGGNFSAEDNLNNDFQAFCGELCFAAIFKKPFTLNLYNFYNNDPGDSLIEGKTIDIKTTKWPSGELRVPEEKVKNHFIYALMVGTAPTFTFKGFMLRENLITPERLSADKFNNSYKAKQWELKNWGDL